MVSYLPESAQLSLLFCLFLHGIWIINSHSTWIFLFALSSHLCWYIPRLLVFSQIKRRKNMKMGCRSRIKKEKQVTLTQESFRSSNIKLGTLFCDFAIQMILDNFSGFESP